jgi:phosphocarrier protein
MQEFQYTITDPDGIHARPAGLLVKAIQGYKDTTVSISVRDKKADAKKLFALMALGIKQGETIVVSAEGPEAEAALAEAKEILSKNL